MNHEIDKGHLAVLDLPWHILDGNLRISSKRFFSDRYIVWLAQDEIISSHNMYLNIKYVNGSHALYKIYYKCHIKFSTDSVNKTQIGSFRLVQQMMPEVNKTKLKPK
jgi:hypothetical protein